MATENDQMPEDQPTLEEKIADLHINEPVTRTAESDKDGAEGEAVKFDSSDKEQHDLKGATTTDSDIEGEKASHAANEEAEKDSKEDASLPQKQEPRELEIARTEAENSSGVAHVVPTSDYRSRVQGDHEEKEVVPTGIVHENADPNAKEAPQQSKGILQTVTGKLSQTVRSVFGGRTGSRSSNNLEVKKKVYEE